MSDLLVKLYELPPLESASVESHTLRRPMAHEKDRVVAWVGENFSPGWKSEVACAFGESPARCWIAIDGGGRIAGFACYDVTYRGYFGPTGVNENARGKGLGTALLVRTLHTMWEIGYAYAIIGGASSVDYYAKTVGAIKITDSTPGAYPAALETGS